MKNKHVIILLVLLIGGGALVSSRHSSPAPTTETTENVGAPTPTELADTATPSPTSAATVESTGHLAPENVYPIYDLTPGKADTISSGDIQAMYSTNCPSGKTTCTYSQSHRNVPQSEKDAVYAEYEKVYPGITAYCHEKGFTSGSAQRCEVDHFCPVGIGCSNDIGNLWIERADTTYHGQPMGFHQKDDLEAWGIAQVKSGALEPAEFDKKIWADWVAYYLAVNPTYTAVSN